MPTFGSTSTPSSTWDWSGLNTETQLAKYLGTMPEDGYVNEIFFYAAGYTTTPAARGVLWDSNGNVICAGAQVTLPDMGGGNGSQQWNGSGGLSVFVAAGTALYAGWWRDPSKDCAWSLGSGSSLATSDNIDSPHTLSGDFGLSGGIGAYISYTPANPPIIATQAASALSASGAQLNGQVNPNGLDTTWYFEYGPTTGYGSQVPATPVDAGSGTSSVAVDEVLSGLSPGTWHFQLVASNAAGTVYGGDQAFVIGGTGSGHLSFAGTAQAPVPVVTVTAPAGTNESASPTVQWTVALPGGLKAASWRCVVYTKAQVAAGGFTPGVSGSTWDSGVVVGSGLSAAPVGLGNFGTYYAYVQVTSSMGTASAWASISWVQAVGMVGVEIGFQPTAALGNNFVLGSATQAVLGGSAGLGGTVFVDVTRYCSGHISIRRGRSRPTDQYTAGEAQITLRNEDRRFDPLNTASPYYPGIIPRAPLNIYIGGIQVFGGFIDDYNPGWEKPATSTVPVTAHDAFALLACAYINDWEAASELSGQRILDILSNNFPGFPAPVDVAAGNTLLQGNLFGANSKGSLGDIVLNDMQTAANSEWGFFFVARDGTLTFLDRYAIIRQLAAGTIAAVFSDLAADLAAGAFPYYAISAASAVLLLYNEVQGTRATDQLLPSDSPGTQIAEDLASQQAYFLRSLQLPQLENWSDADVLNLCNWVLSLYSQPEVRFDTVTLELTGMDIAQLQQLASLDMTDLCTVKRTPGLPDSYEAMVMALGPSAYWPLGDGAGSATAQDFSGNGNTGTVSGGVTFGEPGALPTVPGRTAALFDGSTGAVTTQVPSLLGNAPTTLSLCAWVKPTELANANIAGYLNGAGDSYAALGMDSAGHLQATIQAPGPYYRVTSSTAYNDGLWHFVALVVSTGTLLLYVDGEIAGSTTGGWSFAFDDSSDFIEVGECYGSGYFPGDIAEVAIFPTALTAAQVAALYQAATQGQQAAPLGYPATIDLLSFIDQIGYELDVSGSTYRLSLSFGSAELQNYFVLNNPTYGVLGTSELAY